MNWINTPNGDQFATTIVRSVAIYAGKGVGLKDAQNRLITFIKTPSHDKAIHTRDLLLQMVKGKRTYAINWSFLTEDFTPDLNANSEAGNSEPPEQSVA